MATKERLHKLVDVLPDAEVATAARVLEALSGVRPGEALDGAAAEAAAHMAADVALPTAAEVRQRFGPAAVVVGTPPIVGIDELRGDFWPQDEKPEEFDATIRRWRDEDRRA